MASAGPAARSCRGREFRCFVQRSQCQIAVLGLSVPHPSCYRVGCRSELGLIVIASDDYARSEESGRYSRPQRQ